MFGLWTLLSISAMALMAPSCSAMRTDFVVETRIVVEKSALESWKQSTKNTRACQCKKEIIKMFEEISKMFDEMRRTYRLGIHFVIKDISILKSDVLMSPLKSTPATDFKMWLRSNKLPSGDEPDLTILYTGQDVVKGTSHDSREVGQVCTENSVGIVQLTGGKSDVVRTAHEIGHVLGAYHDSDSRVPRGCGPESGLIMSSDPENPIASHRFSHCSYASFYYKVHDPRGSSKCLQDGNMGEAVGSQ